MHLHEGETVCGLNGRLAKHLVCVVDHYQWCSTGVLAAELELSDELVESAVAALFDAGYLSGPYHGALPEGHVGRWLPHEVGGERELLLWHITTQGKALAKAPIGEALTREEGEALLEEILDRCDVMNENPRGSHRIESAELYGSLCDPAVTEIGDVDVAVVARIRSGEPAPWRRAGLEGFLRNGHERADVVVEDESWADGPVVPSGALNRAVYPRPPQARNEQRHNS